MSEEDKKEVEETTEETNNDTKQEVDLSDESQESNESEENEQSDDEGIDYSAEYERLQGEVAQKNERIAKQDKKIVKLKQKYKELDDEEIEEEEDDTDVDTKVKTLVQQEVSALRDDIIEDYINEVSTNEAEAKLIRYHFENTVNKTGFSKKEIAEYVKYAKAIANNGKFESIKKLITKSEDSKKTSGKPAFAGTPPKKSTQKVTEYDKKMAEKYFRGDVKKWMKYKS